MGLANRARWLASHTGLLDGGGRAKLVGLLGTQLAVLFLCRGLLLGTGGYQLYVDPALPASSRLLRGICENSLSLWSSANLGHRVLYPSEYLVCGPIVGGLNAGIPAWFISRLLPVAAMMIAAAGMFTLLAKFRNTARVRSTGAVSSSASAASVVASVIYACSAYSFTELVAGHFLYLISLAALPWAAWILLAWKELLPAVLIAGLILAFAYAQIQFFLIAPVSLLLLALLLNSARLAWRSVGSGIVGLLPHLPWIVPLIVYRPELNLSAYLLPGTDEAFSLSPWNSLRLVGYTPAFVEQTVHQWSGIWRPLSFGLVAVALVGLMGLSLRRAALVLGGIALVVYYQWGAQAPGYRAWSALVPWPMRALLRERYALSYITLIVISLLAYVGFLHLLPRWRIGATLLLLGGLVGGVGAFADGHLGPFGSARESFGTSEYLASYVENNGGGPVLTVPFGSIVRGRDWAYFGRNPFSLGGPKQVLDIEGDPNAAALSIVQALADSLNSRSANDLILAREYMNLIGVRFVIDFKNLTGDTSTDRGLVRSNLQALGARLEWENADAALWKVPGKPGAEVATGKSMFLSFGGVYPGALASSAEWQAHLATLPSATDRVIAGLAGPAHAIVHLTKRDLEVTRLGSQLVVKEPVFLGDGAALQPMRAVYKAEVNGSAFAFEDGAVAPQPAGTVAVDGPLDRIIGAKMLALIRPSDLLGSSTKVQDTANVDGLSLREAGIASPVVNTEYGPAVALTAARDEAGLPISLPFVNGATFAASVDTLNLTGSQARVAVVSGGKRILEQALPTDKVWRHTQISFLAPTEARDAYLYIYVRGEAPTRVSQLLIRNLQGTLVELHPQVVFTLKLVALEPVHGGPAGLPQQPPLAIKAELSSVVSQVQDTRNSQKLTLAQAEIGAVIQGAANGQPVVRLWAKRDQAGLPIPLTLVSRGHYSLSVESQMLTNAAARLAVIGDGIRLLGDATLPTAPTWRTTALTFDVPVGIHDLYAYIYLDGPLSHKAEILISNLVGSVAPAPSDVVISQDQTGVTCPNSACDVPQSQWAFSRKGTDRWWSIEGAKSQLLTPAADGFGDLWLVQAPPGTQAALGYLPDRLFQSLLGRVWLILLITTVAVLVYYPSRRVLGRARMLMTRASNRSIATEEPADSRRARDSEFGEESHELVVFNAKPASTAARADREPHDDPG